MPTSQDKRNFIGGLDRDSDLRLVRNGDYTYALNIRNMSSEGQGVGAIESALGNSLVYKSESGGNTAFNYKKVEPDVQVSYIYIEKAVAGTNVSTEAGSQTYTFNISFATGDGVIADFPDPYEITFNNLDTTTPMQESDLKGSTASGFIKFVNDHNQEISSVYNFAVTLVSNITGDVYYDETYTSYISGDEGIAANPNMSAYALKFTGLSNLNSLQAGIDSSQSSVNIGTANPGVNFISLINPSSGAATLSQINVYGMTDTTASSSDAVTIDYKCIGSYEDTRNDKMYYFVASEPGTYLHHILEYDLIKDSQGEDNIISVVFRDTGKASSRVFNWNFDFLITNINRIGDVLYFTQEYYGEPCSINIKKSKKSMVLVDSIGAYQIESAANLTGYSLKEYYPYQLYDPSASTSRKLEYVEVIKRGPQEEPSYKFETDPEYKKNNLFGSMFQFKYRYHYYDQEVSAWSPISKVVPSLALRNNNNFSADDASTQLLDNKIVVTVRNGSGIVSHIEVAVRKCISVGVGAGRGNTGDFMSIAKIANNYTSWLSDPDASLTNTNNFQKINFYNDKLYTFIDRVEGNKLFDAVPRTAKTQTVLGNNRLSYANYKLGFDLPKVKVTLKPKYHPIGGSDPQFRYPYLDSGRRSDRLGESFAVTYYRPDQADSNGISRTYSAADGARMNFWEWNEYIDQENVITDELTGVETSTTNPNYNVASTAGYTSPTGLINGAGGSTAVKEFEDIQVVRGYNTSLHYLDTTTNPLYTADGGIVYPEALFGGGSGTRHWTYTGTTIDGTVINDLRESDFTDEPYNLATAPADDAGIVTTLNELNNMVLTPEDFVLPSTTYFEEKVGFLYGENPLGSGNWCAANEPKAGEYPRIRLNIAQNNLSFSAGGSARLKVDVKFYVREELCIDASASNFNAQDSQLYTLNVDKTVAFDVSITDLEQQLSEFMLSFQKFDGDGTGSTTTDLLGELDEDTGEIVDADTRFKVYHTEEAINSRTTTTNANGIEVADDGVALYKTPMFINGRMYIEFILPEKVKFDGEPITNTTEGGKEPNYRFVHGAGDIISEAQSGALGLGVIKSPGYSFVLNRNGNEASFEYTSSEVGASATFKSGAFHSFGLVYYDEKGRASTVALDDGDVSGFNFEERNLLDDNGEIITTINEAGETENVTGFFVEGTDDQVYSPALYDLADGTSTETYVKFPTERSWGGDGEPQTEGGGYKGHTTIEWRIYHKAPSWAKYYRWAYSKNTTVDDFIQFIAHGSFVNPENENDKRIFLELKGLKGSDESYVDNKGAIIDYIGGRGRTEEDGEGLVRSENKDRIRFIRKRDGYHCEEYIDVKLAGYDYFSQTDSTSPLAKLDSEGAVDVDETPKSGYFIYFNEIDKDGWRHSDVASDSNNDNYRLCLFEIYRPKADPEEESRIFYEFGRRYEIAGEDHIGPNGQNGNGTWKDNHGNEFTNNPAKGNFADMGDVYFKRRSMPRGTTSDPQERAVEDYNLNDFYRTNHHSIGRPNIYSAFSKETQRENNITWSEKYQPETNYNGLSTFNPAYINSKALSKVDGSIQKIFNRDTNVLVIHEDKTYQVPVDKDIVVNASGSSQMGLSRNVLGNPVPYWGHFGISKNPESFAFHGNICYWVDIKRGAVLRLSRDGFTVLSDIKMVDYFRDKSELYDKYDPEYGVYDNNNPFDSGHSLFRIISGYDPKHHEYVVTFPTISHNAATASLYSNWENGGTNWNSEASIPGLGTYDSVTGETIAFSEKLNRWTTFYTFIPEMYGKMNKNFFSFNHSEGDLSSATTGPVNTDTDIAQGGHLWKHNTGNYHKFYDENSSSNNKFALSVPFNASSSTVKTFKALSIEGSTTGASLSTDIVTSPVTLSGSAWSEKENIQYASVPYASNSQTGGDGDEFMGLGMCSLLAQATSENYINQDGTSNPYDITITSTDSDFDASETVGGAIVESNVVINRIVLKSRPVDDVNAPHIFNDLNNGDNIYTTYNGAQALIGTVTGAGTTQIVLGNLNTSATAVTFDNQFCYASNPVANTGVVNGTRLKGSFMNMEMTDTGTTKKEIFAINAIVQRSDLSDR